MSAFTNGFNIGFASGMFNRMFGGFSPFCGFNPFCGYNFFGGFNFSPMFFTPMTNFNVFTSYQMPSVNMRFPSYNSIPANFSSWNNFNNNFSSLPVSTARSVVGDSFESSTRNSSVAAPRTSEDFDKMLKFVLQAEGGYTSNDCGQAGNKGIRQSTYDAYRKRKGLAKQDVKNITEAEVKDCYYNDFYLASGADKIKDAKLALYVFDTAVNMGVGASKSLLSQSGNNAERFNELRLAKYESIAANNPDKKKFLNGWKNRVTNVKNYAARELVA